MVKTKTITTSSTKRKDEKDTQWLHQLASSGSSTSKTESIESYLPEQCLSVEKNDFIEILDYLVYDTDNESLQDEEPEYEQQMSLEAESNFFDIFGQVPDIDNLSEDISVASLAVDKKGSILDPSKDIGKFVDPLTGRDIPSKESFTIDNEVDIAEDQAELEIEDEEQKTSKESELFLPDFFYPSDEKITKVNEVEETLEHFFELEIKHGFIPKDEIDWEAMAKEEETKRVHENISEFLENLINTVVHTCEYVSPEVILRKNLDKRKLVEELLAKRSLYGIENNVSKFFNRKVVEFFRRKKSFRAITPDNPKTMKQDQQKFKYAIQLLDLFLAKESHVSSSNSNIICELQNKYDEAKMEAKNQIESFENNVRKTLFRDNRPKNNVLIGHLLLKMNKYREEIHEVRFVLLTKQHYQAQLRELLEQLEDLGHGLSIRDFSFLQAETQTLDKKIEDRNADLKKLHKRCNKDIHTMAHYREKQKIMRNKIALQYTTLEYLTEENNSLRSYLHDLKLNRNNVRRQLQDLSFQGGILDKPALMFDYDTTLERLHQQYIVVDSLRNSLRGIQHKIDKINKFCPME